MSSPKPAYENVNALPVKSFFVTMLTRDISLTDAMLDLLDNCLDGILRGKPSSGIAPYKGYFAEITFSKDSFCIHDNCGGIPWSLHEYAFRMGRPHNREPEVNGTVGTYGIGMKRAIFKLGQECLISTQNKQDRYEVEISSKWINDETTWEIPVNSTKKKFNDDGTTIVIGKLHPGISAQFGDNSTAFNANLVREIESHYAFIINKGFTVRVNGVEVISKPTKLVFTPPRGGKSVQPFIYTTQVDGVDVFLTIGFTRPIPEQQEVLDEQEEKKYSSLDAGWTILCNDRAVLYCDRTEVTGWGEAGIPRFHTQFIAISGIVEFRCTDASKLPTTTTKRGINASSVLYLQVKNKMREGMQLFVDYTNKWKGDTKQSKEHIKSGEILTLDEIKARSESLTFSKVTKGAGGKQFKPKLPLPKKEEPNSRRLTFTRDIEEIQVVKEYLFGDKPATPAEVGDKCFDEILKEAAK